MLQKALGASLTLMLAVLLLELVLGIDLGLARTIHRQTVALRQAFTFIE